jgi:hypothetical protein
MEPDLRRVRGAGPLIESGAVQSRSTRIGRNFYIPRSGLLLWGLVLCGLLLRAFIVPGGARSSSFADEKPAGKTTARIAKTERGLSRKALQAKLLVRTELKVEEASLAEVVKLLSGQHDVPIRLDPQGLKKAGPSAEKKISLNVRNFTLNATLRKILTGSGLHHVIDGGAIVITDVNTVPAAEAAEKEAAEKDGQPVREAVVARGARGRMARLPAAAAAQEQQYLAQLSPVARAELQFVRRVCDPTPEQRRLLAAEAASALQVVAKEYAEAMHKLQHGGWRSGKPFPQPREQILAGFAVAVPVILTAGQAARYADEAARREANRRQVTIRGVVVKLDQKLELSTDQRERLCKALAGHWDPSWSQIQSSGAEFLPPISENVIAPILNAVQLKVWKSIPKGTAQNFGNFHAVRFLGLQNQRGPANGEDGDDLDLALKELAEKKPAKPELPQEAN